MADLLDTVLRQVQAEVERATRRMRRIIGQRNTVDELRRGGLRSVAEKVAAEFERSMVTIRQTLRPLVEAGYRDAARDIERAIGARRPVLGRIIADDPLAMRALVYDDMAKIRQISTITRQQVEAVIIAARNQALTPAQITRQLRSIVGLTSRQVVRVAAYRTFLEAQGRAAEQVDRMVAREASRQLRIRAARIAHTETMRSLGLGNKLQRDGLVRQGVLDPSMWEQEWITADDERTCVICAPMHGERIPIGGAWQLPYDSGAVAIAHAHPNCRCTSRVMPIGFRRGKPPTPVRRAILERLGVAHAR